MSFHVEPVDIYNSLRDLHTRYTLPRPFNAAAAFLPFLLKEFTEDGRRRYLVRRRRPDESEIPHETFRFGVEVTQWNGVPIARAIERFAERIPGAKPDARHVRAVDRFTFRALGFGPPPDEELLAIGYIDHQGQNRQIDLRWSVSSFAPGSSTAPWRRRWRQRSRSGLTSRPSGSHGCAPCCSRRSSSPLRSPASRSGGVSGAV